MKTRPVLLVFVLLTLAAGVIACAPARPRDPVTVVQTAYDRLNQGDVDGFMAFYSDKAVMSDPHGRYAGAQAIREYAGTLVSQQFRFELSNLRASGNVVTYTSKLYIPVFGDTPADTLTAVTVVADGLIIFDGTAALYRLECSKDPTQAFCVGN